MAIIQIIISTVISTGIMTALVSHWYDKKIKVYEIKLPKYLCLIEELAQLVRNSSNNDKLWSLLNEALLFASDDTVGEILRFNKLFTKRRQTASDDHFQMEARDIQPLIIAIRKDLYLKSKSITQEGLQFFQKLK